MSTELTSSYWNFNMRATTGILGQNIPDTVENIEKKRQKYRNFHDFPETRWPSPRRSARLLRQQVRRKGSVSPLQSWPTRRLMRGYTYLPGLLARLESREETVADLNKNKEPVPAPISSRPYSGKFMVRVPPEVHRMLAIKAAESGVSLNRLVSSKLS